MARRADQKWIRRGTHRSVKELTASITYWVGTWNEDPRPYVWHKTADEIFYSFARYCQRISESEHSSTMNEAISETVMALVRWITNELPDTLGTTAAIASSYEESDILGVAKMSAWSAPRAESGLDRRNVTLDSV
jgi:hypothetical protein